MGNSILTAKITVKRPPFLFEGIGRMAFFKRLAGLNIAWLVIVTVYKKMLGMRFVDSGMILDNVYSNPSLHATLSILYWALFVVIILLYFYIIILRCNNRNRSFGFAVLFTFLPIIGTIWGLIECLFLPGVAENNRFEPKYTEYLVSKVK